MVYRFAECELDERLYQLRREGSLVALEPKVFDVLVYLVQHCDRIISKDELLDKLWPGQVVGENALTRCIRAARSAVGDDGVKQAIIATQHGRGYRFIAAVTAAPVSSIELRVPSQTEIEKSQLDDDGLRTPDLQDPSSHSPDSSFSSLTPNTQPPALIRSWSIRSSVLTGVLLLVGIIVMVQYLSQPSLSTQSSVLVPEEAQPPSLTLPDKPSIAVMPFTNMSGDPEQEYFSDGITEDLTTDLSKLSGLFVIARNSAFTYKGKAVKVQDVSRELGVRYVLEGSVRKADSQVRVTVQLIDALSGQHLWAEHYDRPLQDIFALQGEIERKIVAYLALRLTKGEQERIWSQYFASYTGNPDAYDSYMHGREYLYRNSKEVHAQSRQLFERAIALDPTYTVAYVALGFTYLQEWTFQWSQDPKTLEQAFAFAQKALALDDSLPTAHLLLGRVYQAKHKHEQAIAEAERAVVLAPSYANGYATLGQILNAAGRSEDAIEVAEKALRLDPLNPVESLSALGNAYRLTERYEEAIATFKKLLNFRNHPVAHIFLAVMYSELGREEEARAEAAEVLRDMPNFSLEGWRQKGWKDQTRLERDLEALRKAGLK